MRNFLTLDSVSAQTPEHKTLFRDLTLSLGAERVGVVGRNGSGKSTLLRIVAGVAKPSGGVICRSGTIGVLEQEWPGDWTLAQALGAVGHRERHGRILSGNGMAEDFDEVDWSFEQRLESALGQVGLQSLPLERRMGTLSGGERTLIGIVRLIVEVPDLILLDEPTNNLDIDGHAAIHALVKSWRGGILAASHDRQLLESMDRIVELTTIGVTVFGGGWSAFALARESDRKRAAAELERANAAARNAQRAAQTQREGKERRDKAGRTSAAKGSEPKILLGARAERAENSSGRARTMSNRLVADALAETEQARARVEVLTPLKIDFPASRPPPMAKVLALDEVIIDVCDRRLGPWTLHIDGPERVVLEGRNGAGKTTLLRIAAGLLVPVSGTVQRAEGRVVMLDQHVAMLDRESSILDNVRRLNPGLSDGDSYAVCARFAFRNRNALQIVGTLSGGERMRAGLAAILASSTPPWLIILDEPTNHLDIESVELLEEALQDFGGALLIVSHEPLFIKRVGLSRVVAI